MLAPGQVDRPAVIFATVRSTMHETRIIENGAKSCRSVGNAYGRYGVIKMFKVEYLPAIYVWRTASRRISCTSHFHSFVYIRRAANTNIKLDADEILTGSIT